MLQTAQQVIESALERRFQGLDLQSQGQGGSDGDVLLAHGAHEQGSAHKAVSRALPKFFKPTASLSDMALSACSKQRHRSAVLDDAASCSALAGDKEALAV